MRLVVDGIIFQQQAHGGVRRVHTEVLRRRPDDVDLRLFTEGPLAAPLPAGLTTRRLPSMVHLLRPGRVWAPVVPAATRLVRASGTPRGDVWHSTYYTRPARPVGAEVVTVHDMIHERFADRYTRDRDDQLRFDKRDAVEHADAVITVSAATAHDLQEAYGLDLGDRLHVIPLAPTGRTAAPGSGPPTLLHVGGRAGYKGFATLLEAYATWSGREEVSLIAAGRPWTPDEERALHELGVADRVRLVAEPDDRELAELYAAPGVLVQPSEAEGFGLTVLEAMAAGRAVAAARIPPTEEVGGEVPFWFEPGDVEGLHAALDLALAADEDRRAAGRRRAAGFSWDATADATYDVLRSVAP